MGRGTQYRRGAAAIFADSNRARTGYSTPRLLLAAARLGSPVWRRHRPASRRAGTVQPAAERVCGRLRRGPALCAGPPCAARHGLASPQACWRPWWALARPSGWRKARRHACTRWALPWPRRLPSCCCTMWIVRIAGRRLRDHLPRPGRVCPSLYCGAADPLQHGLCACGLVCLVGSLGAAAARPLAAAWRDRRLRGGDDAAGAAYGADCPAPDPRLREPQYHDCERGGIPAAELAGVCRRLCV